MGTILKLKTVPKRGKNMECLDILQFKLQLAQYVHRPIVFKIEFIARKK